MAVVFGVLAVPAGVAAGVAFAGGVNLHYPVHRSWLVAAAALGVIAFAFGWASLLMFGVRLARGWKIASLVLLGWTAGYFALMAVTYPSSAAAARRDRSVLRALPIYPGARFVGESVSGTRRGGGDFDNVGFLSPPTAFETDWTWRVRRAASNDAILDWYQRRLRTTGWRMTRDNFGHGAGGELDSISDGRMTSITVEPPTLGPVDNTTVVIIASVGPAPD